MALLVFFLPVHPVTAQTPFQNWLDSFFPIAHKQGVSQSTWQEAFEGISDPDMVVLEKAAYQPEFKTKIWDYLDTRVNSKKVAEGRRQQRYYTNTLLSVSQKFGVEPEILLAIWSMESNFGEALKKRTRLHYVPQALATLAWKDKKRRKFARSQLIASLKILQAGDVSREQLVGSWAGAMGHTQFIPTSYLAYGVDMDRNGRRDIWNSVPDALATAANLLKKNGWRTGKAWGYEVVSLRTKGFAELVSLEGETKLLSEWQELGVVRPEGLAFPWAGERAELKFPAGVDGPAFLLLKNFFVIKRYNNADAYAFAVGLLADRIAGKSDLIRSWPRPVDALTFEEKLELQQLLKQLGFYDGAIDGALGSGSRAAVRSWQKAAGQTGRDFSMRDVFEALRSSAKK